MNSATIRNAALVAGLLGVLIWSCAGCSRARALNVVGSTSVAPPAEVLAANYHKQFPDRRMVHVQGLGSAQGVVSAENGMADIGTCSRDLKPEEKEQLTAVLIARDGLAVIVNNSNPLTNLTTKQIQDLFSGRVTNWKEVGGPDKDVTIISREEGSGTRESFMELMMKGETISPNALNQSSNGSVKALVTGDPNAISYMSLGEVGSEARALQVDGISPTVANILDGTYKFSRPFLFLTKGAPSPDAQQFIDYVLSTDGQDIIQKQGFVRVK